MTTTTKTKTTKRQATRLMKAEQEAIKKGVCFLSAVTNNSYLHITNRTLPKNVFDLEPTYIEFYTTEFEICYPKVHSIDSYVVLVRLDCLTQKELEVYKNAFGTAYFRDVMYEVYLREAHIKTEKQAKDAGLPGLVKFLEQWKYNHIIDFIVRDTYEIVERGHMAFYAHNYLREVLNLDVFRVLKLTVSMGKVYTTYLLENGRKGSTILGKQKIVIHALSSETGILPLPLFERRSQDKNFLFIREYAIFYNKNEVAKVTANHNLANKGYLSVVNKCDYYETKGGLEVTDVVSPYHMGGSSTDSIYDAFFNVLELDARKFGIDSADIPKSSLDNIFLITTIKTTLGLKNQALPQEQMFTYSYLKGIKTLKQVLPALVEENYTGTVRLSEEFLLRNTLDDDLTYELTSTGFVCE